MPTSPFEKLVREKDRDEILNNFNHFQIYKAAGFKDTNKLQLIRLDHFLSSSSIAPNFCLKDSCLCSHTMCPWRPAAQTMRKAATQNLLSLTIVFALKLAI
uniref:Uncharacterized protein n=1 Tax=Noccaea caerulescens TaxID=107243 RepID=A0A1J3EQF3_NOCCA